MYWRYYHDISERPPVKILGIMVAPWQTLEARTNSVFASSPKKSSQPWWAFNWSSKSLSVQLVLKIPTYLPPGCDGGRLLGGDPDAVGHPALPPLQKEALPSLSLSSGDVIFFANNSLSKLSVFIDVLKLFYNCLIGLKPRSLVIIALVLRPLTSQWSRTTMRWRRKRFSLSLSSLMFTFIAFSPSTFNTILSFLAGREFHFFVPISTIPQFYLLEQLLLQLSLFSNIFL